MKFNNTGTAGAAVCAVLLLGCDLNNGAGEQELRAIDLADVRGGLTADIVFPAQDNYYQTADNLQFRANIANDHQTSQIEITINESNNNKLGYQMVSTPGPNYTGEFNMRVSAFPYPGKHDIKLRYYNPSAQAYWDAAGSPSTRDDMYINPNIHLYKVKFFNTQWNGGGMGTSLTENFIKPKVDSELPTLSRSSNTIDGPYYGECPSVFKTQWRYSGLSTANIGNCTDMESVLEECAISEGWGCLSLSCYALKQCLNTIWEATDAANDPDSIHVTFVDTLASETCDYGGFKMSWNQNGENRSVIVLHEEFTTNHFVTGLAHELGHGFIGGHTNATESNCQRRCDGGGIICNDNDDCDPSETCDPVYVTPSSRNLMCSFGGRKLNTTQCNLTYQTYAPYVDQI